MTYVRFIEHKGKQIVLLDFVGIKEVDAALDAVAEATQFIGALPPTKANVTCTDVRDTTYDRRIIEAFKAMTKANAPFIRAAAVVSDSAVHRAAIGMIGLISRRKLEAFNTRDDALEWLTGQ